MSVIEDFRNVAGVALSTEEVARLLGNKPFDSCGLGAVVSLTGQPQHEVFQRGIMVVVNLEHRGAESADGKSGDGAGVLFDIPQDFFRQHLQQSLSAAGSDRILNEHLPIGVGQIFLPKEKDHPKSYDRARKIVEEVLEAYGIHTHAWRAAKTDSSVLGPIAAQTEPDTRQIVFECARDSVPENRKVLHEALLEIEARIAAENDPVLKKYFYVCSLSSETIVYKAMVKPSDLVAYHQDLQMFLDMGLKTRVMEVHQRFATNAAPDWKLAHPYRMISHNGEINTIGPTARHAEARTREYVRPGHKAIKTDGSDTAQLDTILAMMVAHGWDPLHAARHLIPPALDPAQPPEVQRYVKATQAISDQADGPAAIVIANGERVAVLSDRNALRPMNIVTMPGILIASSEVGSGLLETDTDYKRILLGSGQAIAVDLDTGRYLDPLAVESELASLKPHVQWVRGIQSFTTSKIVSEINLQRVAEQLAANKNRWLDLNTSRALGSVGFNYEDASEILTALADNAKEMVFSMGNTRPLAVFSNLPSIHARFSNFLVQCFAQVTNPPIDSINEYSSFDMLTRLGDRGNIISWNPKNSIEASPQLDVLELPSPLLTSQEFDDLKENLAARQWKTHQIDATFDPSDWRNIEAHVDRLVEEAVAAVRSGHTQLIVSHKALGKDRTIIPSILMVSAIDKAFKQWEMRHKVNIHAEAADIHDTHSFAMAISSGAETVVPYMAEEVILRKYAPTEKEPNRSVDALKAYKKGMHSGLMKIMSKMGVTTLNSYRGGRLFSVLGLDRAFTEKYLGDADTVVNPISGMTLQQLASSITRNHRASFAQKWPQLRPGGLLRTEADSEINAHTQMTVKLLQKAASAEGTFDDFLAYEREVNRVRTATIATPEGTEAEVRAPIFLRDLFELKETGAPLVPEEVQSVDDIVSNHFAIAAMSFGALSFEGIVALNRAGVELNMEVNSGEGGEAENIPYRSSTKQIASGRFGNTNEYFQNASRHQVKMAQGAKPGEGGQLMGPKVSEQIAKTRHATPGVSLISPPPHHDIYSIEDLGGLLRALHALNPYALKSVKLVAEKGVGEVASGVHKCGSYEVHISGFDGGTGASPATSINHAGWPWEIGVVSTQLALVEKGFREPYYTPGTKDRVSISTDGSIRTGRDVVIAAIFGPRKVSIGTAVVEAGGCLLARDCHSGKCPTGWATQDPVRREKLAKDATERVKKFLLFLGEDTQRWLRRLGVKSLEELRGRTDLLIELNKTQPEAYSPHVQNVDLAPLRHVAKPHPLLAQIRSAHASIKPQISFDEREMDKLLPELIARTANGNDVLETPVIRVSNLDIDVGTRLGGEITRRRMGGEKLRDVIVNLKGIAGESIAGWLPKEITIRLQGEANNFVGRGLSGGKVIFVPANQNSMEEAPFLLGNSCLYGATGGEFYIPGRAGSRFGVRLSGAEGVIRGAGEYASEYMTNGFVVYLDPLGKGAFTGNSGGINFVYDPRSGAGPEGTTMVNDPRTGLPYNFDTNGRQIVRLGDARQQHDEGYEAKLRELLENFYRHTGDKKAGHILGHWQQEKGNFWIVIPDEYARERKNILKQTVGIATGAQALTPA